MSLYNGIKIFHILCATLFLMGIIAGARAWIFSSGAQLIKEKLHSSTFHLIVPFGFLQLLSGFTMISLQHYPLSQEWIKTSLMGFVFLMISWFGFLFFSNRSVQRIFLILCFLSLGSMIFMMANKI